MTLGTMSKEYRKVNAHCMAVLVSVVLDNLPARKLVVMKARATIALTRSA